MSRVSAIVRVAFLTGFALLLPVTGCKDQRAPTQPGTGSFLDGDTIFNTAVVTTSFLRYINEVADVARFMVENGIPNIRETGCSGAGERLFLRDLVDPNRVEIRHGDAIDRPFDEIVLDDMPEPAYVADCNAAQRLTISGYMIIEFQETSPGLRYTIEMPMAWGFENGFEGIARGMVFQLPADFGNGAILDVTTPGSVFEFEDPFFDEFGNVIAQTGAGGKLDCVLEGGSIRITGAVRLEERVQQVLLVEDLELGYAYDAAATPAFAAWPAGSYELGTLSPTQFFGSSVSPPFDIQLDGFGGAIFPLGDRTCQANLLDIENGNPCANPQ